MRNSQIITGGPSYSRDMWDSHGVKMISERIDKSKKSMKHLRDFFQDAANMSFRNAQTTHKLQSMNISQSEFGTLKFVQDRYCELIETMSKNEEILGSKIRTQCYQKLSDQINRISRVNTKLLSDLNSWQKSLEREQKKLRKAKQSYDEKKRQTLAVVKALKMEKEQLNAIKGKGGSQLNKAPQIESNIMALQTKVKNMQSQSREQLENYIRAVSVYRGFRLKYDSSTSTLLDQLEQTECDRSQMLHRVLKLYLEIQQVMVQQSLRNIDTISKHIANIDAHSDNMIFVEKYRSKVKKPDLPDPQFHPDDEDDGVVTFSTNDEEQDVEDTAEVKFWCEKWRLVIGKILERDIELVSPKTAASASSSNIGGNGDNKDEDVVDNDNDGGKDEENGNGKDESFAFIQLTDDEYSNLRAKCLESLNTTHGRTAFSLIINRQRNTEYGLELQKEQFLGLVVLFNLFLDSVQQSEPLDIKPAKLVMIMSQSLYVKKLSVLDILTKEEKQEIEEMKADENNDQNPTHQPQQSSLTSFSPKNNKLFIQDRIKEHEIWKNDKFWKEAYCDSVQQEILKYPAVKKWHSDQEKEEAERREEQIIFSQLAAWTHNMKEFGTDDHKILTFLDSRGLKPEQVAVLKATLQLNENTNPSKNKSNDDQKGNELVSSFEDKDNVLGGGDNVNTFETASGSISPTSSTGLP